MPKGGDTGPHLALALGTMAPRLSASSIRAAHTADWRRVAADPRIHKARFALVMLTFKRLTSFRKPTPDAEGLARTALRMMTSSWRPW